MGETYQDLVRWATDRGVELSGIEPRMIPGKGTGIFATRDIKAGETLLAVPTQAFHTLDSVPKRIIDSLPRNITMHCLLATYLSLDMTTEFSVWSAVFPTLASFETSTPFMWPPELHTLLPKPASTILKKQQTNFKRDWKTVSGAFPHISQEQYLHAWLLINSRSFYFTTPSLERFPHDDRLALLPVADLFNHAPVGCDSAFTSQSYTFTADRAYRSGEEVYTCYGNHSNDFLLAEYGFVLAENRCDAVCLDDVVLPSLSRKQKATLSKRGLLGDCMLNPETSGCFRTQVALRMLGCGRDQWRLYADAGLDDGSSQQKVHMLLKQSLNRYIAMIKQTLEEIKNLNAGQASQRELLLLRWEQIENMVVQTVRRLDD